MIEELKSNIEKEQKIVQELVLFSQKASQTVAEKSFFNDSILSLLDALNILNSAIPEILSRITREEKPAVSSAKPPPLAAEKVEEIAFKSKEKERGVVKIGTGEGAVTITAEQKKEFLKDLRIEKDALKKLNKGMKKEKLEKEKKEEEITFQKPNPFTALASKLFPGLSLKLASKSKKLGGDLRKANMPYILNSYISMIILGTAAAAIFGLVIAFFIALVSQGDLLVTIPRNLAISLLLPALVFAIFYSYPASQAKSIQSKINEELPFALMHLAAIAGSGVEPSRVFKILATSKDYPKISIEFRKLMNLINFYGYDIMTALRETSKTTSSKNLADLLNGMSTIISSGGNLRSYLDNSAANSLLEYKLSRERYVEVSGTYADVYTGLLIAAPLIFMLMLSLIGSMDIGVGIQPDVLSIMGIVGIIFMNIGFLVFLQVQQPES